MGLFERKSDGERVRENIIAKNIYAKNIFTKNIFKNNIFAKYIFKKNIFAEYIVEKNIFEKKIGKNIFKKTHQKYFQKKFVCQIIFLKKKVGGSPLAACRA